MLTLTSLLEGRWVEGVGPGTRVHDAATEEVIGVVSSAGADLHAALRYARAVGGPALRAMTFSTRGALVKTLSRAIHAHRDELIALSTASYGATRGDAKFDIDGASGTMAYYANLGVALGDRKVLLDGEAEPVGRSTRLVGQHVQTPRRGVAVHINAFNFPAWGMCEKLAVSLVAGMPALVKPATSTLAVTRRVVEIWHDEGLLPPGAVSLLCGSAGDLLDHLEIQDVIAFTGGSETARTLRAHPRVIELGIPLNVEADSLNAAVLAPDVDAGEIVFDQFIADVVRDIVQKAGQKCTAIRRVFVPVGHLDAVREALTDALSRVELGVQQDGDTVMGPVSTAAQRRDVLAGLAALSEQCDTFVPATAAVPELGYYVAPRVMLARPDTTVVHEREVFGPVTSVIPYDGTPASLASLIARGGGGLVASVYSDDAAWVGEVIGEIAPWHGRICWGSKKVADQSPGPGTVMPNLLHGGPGKAGGGEELGGRRGLAFYLQRTAIQADRGMLDRVLSG